MTDTPRPQDSTWPAEPVPSGTPLMAYKLERRIAALERQLAVLLMVQHKMLERLDELERHDKERDE